MNEEKIRNFLPSSGPVVWDRISKSSWTSNNDSEKTWEKRALLTPGVGQELLQKLVLKFNTTKDVRFRRLRNYVFFSFLPFFLEG